METSKVFKDMASELSKSVKPESLPLITSETSAGIHLLFFPAPGLCSLFARAITANDINILL